VGEGKGSTQQLETGNQFIEERLSVCARLEGVNGVKKIAVGEWGLKRMKAKSAGAPSGPLLRRVADSGNYGEKEGERVESERGVSITLIS